MKIISAADLTAEAAAYVGSLPRSSNPFLYLNKFVIHEVEVRFPTIPTQLGWVSDEMPHSHRRTPSPWNG